MTIILFKGSEIVDLQARQVRILTANSLSVPFECKQITIDRRDVWTFTGHKLIIPEREDRAIPRRHEQCILWRILQNPGGATRHVKIISQILTGEV